MSQLDKIKFLENVLVRLIKCEHYFELSSGLDGKFWPIVQNAIGESTCVFWCHIFGNRRDELHFTQFFKSESVFTPDTVKSRMLAAMKMSDPEYAKFWEEVKNCRDKFISHKEVGASVIFPHIDKCRIQAEELRKILSEYSQMKSAAETGWDIWVEYYSDQCLGENQFQAECEREFRNGIIGLATELTRLPSRPSAKNAPVG